MSKPIMQIDRVSFEADIAGEMYLLGYYDNALMLTALIENVADLLEICEMLPETAKLSEA